MKKQPVLILQHSDGTPPGSTLTWLAQKQLEFHLHKFTKDGAKPLPQLDQFSSLIICGGGMNVDEERLYPWLKEEKKLIESALKRQMPIIGLCLGAQLIAEVLGATVGRHPHPEAGWQSVEIQKDVSPTLTFSQEKLRVFQFHRYSFAIAKGARHFARNQACENQGFIYQDRVVGVQFHPEATQEWIEECAEDFTYPEGDFCQKPQEVLRELDSQAVLQDWYFTLLRQMILNS